MLCKKIQDKIENIQYTKQSNLIVSLDLTKASEILTFINNYGYRVLGIKLHSDIICFDNMSISDFMYELLILKQKMNIILIEDRKFCDIGNTVQLQSFDITKYADLITVHSIPGQGIIDGLRKNCVGNECGILLISQMSTENNLISSEYTEKTKQLALNNPDVVFGFICQEKMNHGFFNFSPGVKLQMANDSLGQQYKTPSYLCEKGIDFFIVGRDIYESQNPQNIIEEYNLFYRSIMSKKYFKNKVIDAEIIKTGNFVLSSGETTSVYADFRLLNGNSNLLKLVAKEFARLFFHMDKDDLVLMGVPMGGISLATAISLETGIPFVIVRDKRKEYGSKNLIEGMSIDQLKTKKIILVEDVITTGGSIEKIINKIQDEENLNVSLVACILDRCKGGDKYIFDKYGVEVLKLLSLNDFLL